MSGLINKLVTDGNVQLIGLIPGAVFSSANIRIVNPTVMDQAIKAWISTSDIPGTADLVESGAIIPANGGKYNETGIITSPGEKVFVQAAAGLVVRLESVDET